MKFTVRCKHFVTKFGSRCFSLLKIYIVQSHTFGTLNQSCQCFFHQIIYTTLHIVCRRQNRGQNSLNCLAYIVDWTKDLKMFGSIYIWRNTEFRLKVTSLEYFSKSFAMLQPYFYFITYLYAGYVYEFHFIHFSFINEGKRQRLLLSFGLSTNIKTILSTKILPQVMLNLQLKNNKQKV